MKITNELLNRLKEGKVVCEIKWLDIASKTGEEKIMIKNTEPKEMLVACVSYGKVYKFDNYAVVIMTEDSGEDLDYTVIPKGNIVDIIELERSKK